MSQNELCSRAERRVLLLGGANINLIGKRETDIYGSITYTQLLTTMIDKACSYNINLECHQSNHEGELVDLLQQELLLPVNQKSAYIIINPGAYTHTSIAIRDALLAVAIPFIEVHISNIFARETYRHQSLLADIAAGIICGCGVYGYILALDLVNHYITSK
jgi:3-dehydroquinate dehydratase II